MSSSFPDVLRSFSAYAQGRVDNWRTGSDASQVYVLGWLLALVAGTFWVSWYYFELVPLTAWFLWLLAGMLVLRFVPLTILCGAVLMATLVGILHADTEDPRFLVGVGTMCMAIALILFHVGRQRSGLPVALSEPMLAQLRDRLQAQGRMPALPAPWRAQSAMLTAHGTSYAGDFIVADLQEDRWLEMVMVDVCGKGVTVGAQALQFSGALGGLLGALPHKQLLPAANGFLLRQESDDSFATAAHLLVDLETGEYTVNSAGHPPALHWRGTPGGWFIDNARGTALGIVDDPEFEPTVGVIRPGEALMFYTDGVVESRGRDLDEGIDWLRSVALNAILARGFPGLARRILRQVSAGADDRAILILERSAG